MQRSGGRCERCRAVLGADSHLHHLTYARRGHELLADVELICLACHGSSHPQHTFRPVADQRAIAAKRAKKRNWTPAPAGEWDDINAPFAKALAAKKSYVRLEVRRATGER